VGRRYHGPLHSFGGGHGSHFSAFSTLWPRVSGWRECRRVGIGKPDRLRAIHAVRV